MGILANWKKSIKSIAKQILYRRTPWSGDYPDWQSALQKSSGYDSENILCKVRDATLKVKNGEAAFERDSVLFYEREYSWPVVSGMLWVAAQNEGKLRLMDFGGSLGSVYYQYRHLLEHLQTVNWCIVEQKKFVEIGKAQFEDNNLKFYPDIETCLATNTIDILFLGCVLPYLKEPYVLLEKITAYKIPFLIIDRMPFIDAQEDRLTVQIVPPNIYTASYPAWFFSYRKFISFIKQNFTIVAEYDCADRANIKSSYKGLILKLHP